MSVTRSSMQDCEPESSLLEQSRKVPTMSDRESQQSPVHFPTESDIASCASDTDDGEYETPSEGPLKTSQSKLSDLGHHRRAESSASESSGPIERGSVQCLAAMTDSTEGTLVNSPTQGSAILSGTLSTFASTQGTLISPSFGKSKSTSALKCMGLMEGREKDPGGLGLTLMSDSFTRQKKMNVVLDFRSRESTYTMDVSTNTSMGDLENDVFEIRKLQGSTAISPFQPELLTRTEDLLVESPRIETQTKSRHKRKEVKCDIRITENPLDNTSKGGFTGSSVDTQSFKGSFSIPADLQTSPTIEVTKKPGVTNDLKALLRIDGELGPLRRQLNEITGMFKALHQTGFAMDLQTQPLPSRLTGYGPSRLCQDGKELRGRVGRQLPGYVMIKPQLVQEESITRSLGDGQPFLPPDNESSLPIDVPPPRKIQDKVDPSRNQTCDANARKPRGQSTGRSDRENSSWQRSAEPEARKRLSHPYQDSDYEGGTIEPDRTLPVPTPSGLCRSCRRRSSRNSFSPGKFFDFRSPPTPLEGSGANRAGLHGARRPGVPKKTLTAQEKCYPSSERRSPTRWNDLTQGYHQPERTRPRDTQNQAKGRDSASKNNHTSSESMSCTQSFCSSAKTGDSPVIFDGMCSGVSSFTGRTFSANPTPRSKKQKCYTSTAVSPIASFMEKKEKHACRRTHKAHRDQSTQDARRIPGPDTEDRTRHKYVHCRHGVKSWVMRNDQGVPVKTKYRVPISACEVSGSKTDLKVHRSGFSLKCEEEQLVFEASLETLMKSSHSKDTLDCKSPRHSDLKAGERSYKFIVVPVVFTNGVPELSKTRLLNVSKFSSVKHVLTKCSHKILKVEGSSHSKSMAKCPDTLASIPAKLREESPGHESRPSSFHSTSCSRHGRSLERMVWIKPDRTKCPKPLKPPKPTSPYVRKNSSVPKEVEKVHKVVPGLRCSPEDFLYDT